MSDGIARLAALLLAGTACASPGMVQAQAEALSPSLTQPTAPKGAPNIVLVLLDDVGFGAASTFGGPATTPVLGELAKEGLKYNRFHTTGICSPSRAALLTGRNPHATGIGAVMNAADGRPGYSGHHGKDTATIAEVLRQNGYNTAAFGKWHQTADWEMSQSGPFDRWPTQEGFETFYGFQGGETNQFEPTLFEGTTPTMRPAGEGYHLTEDLATRSIAWMRAQHSLTPEKPFLLYFSTGAIHAPIQVPKRWVDKYRGQFDGGWDKLREEIFARQKRLGVIPADAKLTPRPAELPAWDSLSPQKQAFASRLMEAYAGFLSHTDEQIGRLVQALKDNGEYDNTLIVYMVGDNGASLEGGLEGSLNYLAGMLGLPEPEAQKLARIDDIGTERANAHVNTSWAWATNTPYQWGKTMPAYLGAVRNPMVMSWPRGIKRGNGMRSQFAGINDITPTILDIVGIPMPKEVNGIPQKPLNGVSLRYTFYQPNAPERHRTQYFEVFGSRSIYSDGWFAAADHGRLPWTAANLKPRTMEEDVWRLYDLRKDFSQSTDLAAQNPQKLEEMKALFMQEAAANQVLPLGGQVLGDSGLPQLSKGVTSATYHAGTVGIPEPALPKMANRSWSIAARLAVTPESRGVIAAVGGHQAGWSLYLDAQRHAVFTYRTFDVQTAVVRSANAVAPDTHDIKVDFTYDGKGYARGGGLALSIDGKPQGTGRLVATTPNHFTIDETFDIGIDRGSAVDSYSDGAPLGYPFQGGAIDQVRIDLK